MTIQLTRSFAIALALTIGVVSAPTAFSATRGNVGTTSSSTGGNGDHSDRPLSVVIGGQDNCNSDRGCIRVIPRAARISAHCSAAVLNGTDDTRDCHRDTND